MDVPLGNVDTTLVLGDRLLAKHTGLGATSPLNGQVNMVAFGTLITDIRNNRVPAVADSRQKEAWNEQALTVIGIAKGQNLQVPNTVYWHINKVHKFMAFKFKGNEEQASLWGFNVVVTETGGRRNVSFNVPYLSPTGLLDLATAIISKHTTDGAASILIPALFDMVDFGAKTNTAIQLRDDALVKDQASQAANELARNLCGYGEGQTSETPDTLYWYITQCRDLLLIVHEGNEEQLSTWGFNVVVSTSTSTPGADPAPGPEPTLIDFGPSEGKVVMTDPLDTTHLTLQLTGGPLLLSTSSSPGMPGPMSFTLNDGETFSGTIKEMGLPADKFLNGMNQSVAPAQLSIVAV